MKTKIKLIKYQKNKLFEKFVKILRSINRMFAVLKVHSKNITLKVLIQEDKRLNGVGESYIYSYNEQE